MTDTEKDRQAKALEKAFNKLRKDGLIVDVIGQDGIVTMLTAKGHEQWDLLGLFVQVNQANPNVKKEKPKKSGQEKMDSAIKPMVTIGAGISQMMQGIGSLAGDPVKMDMSQAGIDIGQGRQKKKRTYKKGKQRKNKR